MRSRFFLDAVLVAVLQSLVVCPAALLWFSGSANAAVLISEVLPDPASDWDADGEIDSRGDEWVEVINTGPGPVDLDAYYLRDALGDDPQIRFSGTLAAGETALFLGSDALAWQAAEGLSATGLSLNNAGDMLELYLGHPLEGASTLVDALIYPDHAGVDDRSLARFLPEDVWVLCDGLHPYGGAQEPPGTGCLPTPGEINTCAGLVADESSSWGQVKNDYR
ncbi:lamin tail domain-containing protein [bacterium]|nr:lamin tail domain-containing protein [bacterium]